MSDDNQNRSEANVATKVVDENGKEVALEGDHFTPYRHRPLIVSSWKLRYMVQVTTPEREIIGDIGDWLVVGPGSDVYIFNSDVFDLHYSPVTSPPEMEPVPAPTETTDSPIVQWKVALHCEIAFKPDILMPAWHSRLPHVAIDINFQTSTGDKTVFNAVVLIGASSNAGACSMARGLLKRHFDTIEILQMEADQT